MVINPARMMRWRIRGMTLATAERTGIQPSDYVWGEAGTPLTNNATL